MINLDKNEIDKNFEDSVIKFKESMGKVYELLGENIAKGLEKYSGFTENDKIIEPIIKVRMERDFLKIKCKELKSAIRDILEISENETIKKMCQIVLDDNLY